MKNIRRTRKYPVPEINEKQTEKGATGLHFAAGTYDVCRMRFIFIKTNAYLFLGIFEFMFATAEFAPLRYDEPVHKM